MEFASRASSTLARLSNVTDTVAAPTTPADAAVLQILVAVNTAAMRTVQGIADGLIGEAGVMDATAGSYERCEDCNESIAQKAGS